MLVQCGVSTDDVLAEGVDLRARFTNLVIESLLLASFLLELHKFIFLVKDGLNTALLHHVCDDILSLLGRDAQELADLLEANVHVDMRDDQDVVLNQRLLKHRVAISCDHVLPSFELVLEIFDVLGPNDGA